MTDPTAGRTVAQQAAYDAAVARLNDWKEREAARVARGTPTATTGYQSTTPNTKPVKKKELTPTQDLPKMQELLPEDKLAGEQKAPEQKYDQYKDWTAQELMTGKIKTVYNAGKGETREVYTPSPYGASSGTYKPYPIHLEDKIIEAQQEAINKLKDYLQPGITKDDVSKAMTAGDSKKELAQMSAAIGQDYIDVNKAVKDGKDKELRLLGVPEDSIKKAKAEAVLLNTVEGQNTTNSETELLKAQLTGAIQKQLGLDTVAGNLASDLVISMIPIVGTVRDYNRAKADGKLTDAEIGWIAASAVMDIISIVPIVGAAGVAARGVKGLSTGARVAAGARSAAEFTLLEFTGAYQTVRHPLNTAKGVLKNIETIVRPSKLPLAATEVSYSTVRLPVKAFASGEQAMTVRDIGVMAAMKEGKFSSIIGDITMDLPPARLQSVGDSIAMHTAPDIRPFMEGATIQYGREGGLFVAPNLHSRFSLASAFGDMPEGGVRGALIIRDEALLKQLGGSGKIYNNTAEVEAVLKAGVELPPPSQTLITRAPAADTSKLLKEASALRVEGKIDDALALEKKAAALKKQGDKLTLLVYGKPYTPAEITKLKILGALDNLKQIFTPAARLKKGTKAITEYDELIVIRKEATELIEEAGRLKKAGKTEEALQVERRADELIEDATRTAKRLSSTTSGLSGPLRIAVSSTNRTTAIDRVNRLQGSRASTIKLSKEQMNRLRNALDNKDVRDALTRINNRADLEKMLRVEPSGRLSIEGKDVKGRPAGITRGDSPKRAVTPTRANTPPPRDTIPTRDTTPAKDTISSNNPSGKNTLPPGRTPPPPRITRSTNESKNPSPYGKDKEKRNFIYKAGGAIAWRQGQVGGKDRWDVIVNPYQNNEQYVMVLGSKPKGAAIVVKGPKSAYATAQLLRGKAPKHKVHVDSGFQDVTITPAGDKKVNIRFSPDPKGLTQGDIQIGDKNPRISPKMPRLT